MQALISFFGCLSWNPELERYVTVLVGIILLATAIVIGWGIPRILRLSSATQSSKLTQHEEASERLEKIANLLPSVVFQFRMRADGSFCIPYANEALRSIYRLNPEDVRDDASAIFNVTHPDDLERHIETIKKSARELSPWCDEYRLKFEDGTECWLAGNAIPQQEADGSILWHGFVSDITERKQIELNLKASENRFKELFDNAPLPYQSLDINGNFLYVNQAWLDLVGCQREKVIGHFFGDFMTESSKLLVYQTFSQFKTEGYVSSPVFELIRRDTGEERLVTVQGKIARDNKGMFQRTHCILSDITEQYRAEQELKDSAARFQLLIEQLPLALVLVDKAENIVYMNKRFKSLFGYSLEDIKTVAEWYLHAYPNEDYRTQVISTWTEAINKAANQDTDIEPIEYLVTCKNGEHKVIVISGIFIDNSLLATFTNVTERKIMESELKRSNAELEQFAYAVSHDMRQPLRMVASYLSLIESALATQLDEETHQFLTFAVDGAKRMDAMILSLLDYSRVGRSAKISTIISTRHCIDEALVFLKTELETSSGKVIISGDWIDLVANRDELTRLLQNLIGNALKYHEENKPPQIEVSATVIANSFKVEVRDSGIGIASNQINRLFKVFSRLQSRERFEGTGVGLALCRKIVEHHGGKIGVESKGEGLGCVFWFELPIVTKNIQK